MYRRLKFSSAARQDLVAIQATSRRLFGPEQAVRYKLLIAQALRDIDDEPERPDSQARPVLGERFRSYRVELSRKRSGTGVKRSHHIIVYVSLSGDFVGVSRILHDAMLMEQHIPESHLYGDEAFLSDEEE
ncbi:MAG: type II toxin-antitoxin system RelE/ParE family toxin [Candidatus Hydrogenedentes bacterium]|nr:type II toxin-antitoxin system RelE/ParE family toxin [Candidatus Hydrogenedentota bacterium]